MGKIACLCCVLAWGLVGCDGGGGDDGENPLADPTDGPPAGNPNGTCAVPAEAALEDTSNPAHVVGTGTKDSCTGEAFAAAVALGGVITFDCGPDPVTIDVTRTAKIFNDTGPKIVIDGKGKVVLDGKGKRILYMNTCDQAQKFTTPHCQNQDHPQLTVQNLTFVNGDATGEDPDGGGAIFFVSNNRTGHLRIDRSVLRRNPSHGFETLPGIFVLAAEPPIVTASTIE